MSRQPLERLAHFYVRRSRDELRRDSLQIDMILAREGIVTVPMRLHVMDRA